ncbi:DUF3006 domain-containing protein [Clostridium sp. Ade.TY]|uniref:DUF3006 domain-containing protein n=1 Tax=Clostridium sp. Ade.TY TaxID=1391647 RepID=UPI000406388B|nr:DUF3006 domain-containing protein [Clostridium sp. Ade.TY]
MRNLYIVDRCEGEYYILQSLDNEILNVPKNKFSIELKSGDVVYEEKNKYYYSKEETTKRKKHINELMKGMWNE